MNPLKSLLIALTLAAALLRPVAAAPYQVGDIVTEVTNLVDRATGEPVPLSRLEGHVLFIDFFAHWCPVCRGAAPQILREIDDWYETRRGNPEGVPILHIGANLQADNSTANRNATTTFINTYRIPLTIQDTSRRLQARFGPTSGQPTFVIINGLTNSPSHRPWQLLYARFSYQDSAQSRPIEAFRSAIDSVQSPLPGLADFTLLSDGRWQFSTTRENRVPLRIEWSDGLGAWSPTPAPLPPGIAAVHQIPAATTGSAGYLRIVR